MSNVGPYQKMANLKGIEAGILRKNLNNKTFIIWFKVGNYNKEEMFGNFADIKTLDDVYKLVLIKVGDGYQ